jgi:hypothetical protein
MDRTIHKHLDNLEDIEDLIQAIKDELKSGIQRIEIEDFNEFIFLVRDYIEELADRVVPEVAKAIEAGEKFANEAIDVSKGKTKINSAE